MLKRLGVALAALFCFANIAHGAGTVPGFSLTPQFDLTGKVAPGCKLYVYQAGSSNPQNVYQDSGLTLLHPNPMTCDAAGRLPQWFVADGTIKLRLTKSDGTQIFVGDSLLVVGPSSGGGGGGGTVDPTTILATGDMKIVYGTGVLTGFVRANGRTIGSATSGATERANADCQSLFIYLWGADANLVVSGGRGASAAADWAANKTMQLPDARGATLANLDDMGNSARGTFTGVTFGTGNATTLGSYLGTARRTLSTPNLPPYTPSGSISGTANSAQSNIQQNSSTITVATGGANTVPLVLNTRVQTNGDQYAFTGSAQGGTSAAFDTISPSLLITTYIKL